MATLYAGTSGFAYPSWKPGFYPAGIAANRFLQHYAGRLNCVEINYTFRRLPSATTLAAWVEATPPGFVFAVKAHMRITHILRLKNAEQATGAFLQAIDPLRSSRRLGPALFQLPPNLKRDLALLRDFLTLLPDDMRFAFEFRHESWLAEEIYDELRRRHAALCLAESEKLEIPKVVTAGFVYHRLRKPDYTNQEVDAIGARAGEMLAAGLDVYALFKHEEGPEGALHAESLLSKAGERRSSAPGA